MKTIPTFHTHGTPYVEHQEEIDQAARKGRKSVLPERDVENE